ncbi:hypothetical protein [Chengkuizengella axinellae]|uniref:Permease n=1 Tax=Chengkuizengella axinellae TaxID=3064388 RepID=A0ABT9IUJ9_9BACL|nr:hypothetical protein [Chengkuizengella sp. 2205SS18-9]MDP5273020.1 hypothetical protein [Chengkuizengella sp. 2205SS18-9]
MNPSLNTETKTNIALPLSFILFSLAAFITSQFILLKNGDMIVQGIFRIPEVWMAAHLLLLGWVMMVAMGAMYQLVPVVFLTPIWSEKFGFIQFSISAIGIVGFSLSLAYYIEIAMFTAGLTVLGIVMFLFQMWKTIKKQASKNILTVFVGTALLCLLLTISLGILLVANLVLNNEIMNHFALLKTHILLGLAGWFTLLIFGFSYKMVPMFSLSHGYTMKRSIYVYGTYVAGLLFGIISFWIDNEIFLKLSFSLLFLGFSFFVIHIREILKKRLKKKLDRAFMFSLVAIIFGWILHLMVMLNVLFFDLSMSFIGIFTYLYIFNWIIFSIMGYLYKIVPFLWWTYRYSEKVGKADVPVLKDMVNDKLGVLLFYSFSISVWGVALAILYSSQAGFNLFQGILTILSIVYGAAIINVLRQYK